MKGQKINALNEIIDGVFVPMERPLAEKSKLAMPEIIAELMRQVPLHQETMMRTILVTPDRQGVPQSYSVMDWRRRDDYAAMTRKDLLSTETVPANWLYH